MADVGSGLVEVGTFGAVKSAFKDKPTLFGKDIAEFDPTKIKKAETGGVEAAAEAQKTAAQKAQQAVADRMKQLSTPTVTPVAGPQAGQINMGFLQALQGQLPGQQAALQKMGTQGMGAQAQMQAQEATGMLRAAAMGEAPSAAQLQQKQAFEQAIAAQMAAQAGRAYDPAAMRQAQVAGQQLMGQQAQQAGILAAQEQEKARLGYAEMASKQATTDIARQDLMLRAAQGDVDAQIKLAGLQTDVMKAQAQLQTEAGIAGAQIAGSAAETQAKLQSEANAQMNLLTQLYINAGLTEAQAQMEAAKVIFGAESGRQQAMAGARQTAFGGILSAAGAAGSAAAGAK
jgi:hypothetical protein